ncbi:hypothetical protein [Haliea alexandrii]|uniref:hypothetical protein n=1 Tax=Haliea alexandrii TaxID=2448162 RepID=UPI001304D71C|nr:hypothetical protein [Haliea alexandrii]
MDDNTASFLSQQLYPDLKNWISTLAKKLRTPVKKANAKVFSSPPDLLTALKSNHLQADEWVTLTCKPSTFGPFLRNHFISPIIGHHTNMRLGPQVLSENPIMGILGQVTSHLKPVGIYPPIDDDLYQLCLYPSDAEAFGMIGMLPGMDKLVEYIPAVCSAKHLTFSNVPCNVRGIVRQVSPSMLLEIGVPIERWEEYRQSGDIWFIDIVDEYAEVSPLGEAVTTEIWGGLYASGHMEIADGSIQIQSLVDGMAEGFRSAGFAPHVTQNKAARQEIMVYGKGIRAVIDTKAPLYSIHMDAELGLEFSSNKLKFEKVTKSYLSAIESVAKNCSAEISNLHDLDFSYTESAKSYSILRSSGAELIADPVGVAIRDWHRKRNKSA